MAGGGALCYRRRRRAQARREVHVTAGSRSPVELWRDVSRPLRAGIPVWPGDLGLSVDTRRDGDWTFSTFSATCHLGTHVDTPRHIDPAGPGLDQIPLDRFVGPAEVVVARPGARLVSRDDLPEGWVPYAARVLVRTDSYPLGSPMDAGFAALHPELVSWLAERGVELVGIDTPSVDPLDSADHPSHRALARAGMVWLEGLWLDGIEPGLYVLAALPMALVGVEGAPVRAVLRPVGGGSGGGA